MHSIGGFCLIGPFGLAGSVKQCAEEVYRELSGFHSEAVYETALTVELSLLDIVGPLTILRQVPCPIFYKGFTVGVGYIDLLIDNSLIVEIKAIAKLTSKDEQQVRKYLAATGLDEGLLINFGNDLEMVEIRKEDADDEETIS